MKWPVSAEAFEAVVDLLKAERAEGDQRARDANARYDALLDKYHALKVTGAAPEPAPAAVPERDAIANAIHAKARGNPMLFRHYQTFVAEQRARRIPDESIAAEILNGRPDDLGAIAE